MKLFQQSSCFILFVIFYWQRTKFGKCLMLFCYKNKTRQFPLFLCAENAHLLHCLTNLVFGNKSSEIARNKTCMGHHRQHCSSGFMWCFSSTANSQQTCRPTTIINKLAADEIRWFICNCLFVRQSINIGHLPAN